MINCYFWRAIVRFYHTFKRGITATKTLRQKGFTPISAYIEHMLISYIPEYMGWQRSESQLIL